MTPPFCILAKPSFSVLVPNIVSVAILRKAHPAELPVFSFPALFEYAFVSCRASLLRRGKVIIGRKGV
jgi:hypothetical protein